MKPILFSLLSLLTTSCFAQRVVGHSEVYVVDDTVAVATLDMNDGTVLDIADTGAAIVVLAKSLIEQSKAVSVTQHKEQLMMEIFKCIRMDGAIPDLKRFRTAVEAYKTYNQSYKK